MGFMQQKESCKGLCIRVIKIIMEGLHLLSLLMSSNLNYVEMISYTEDTNNRCLKIIINNVAN